MIMKTFQQFQRGLVKRGFKFTRISERPFGQRVVALKEGTFSDKTYLIYMFTKEQSTISDFDRFLSDFKRLVKKSETDVETGFFLVDEKCRKDILSIFKIILRHTPEDLRKKIKVQQLKR